VVRALELSTALGVFAALVVYALSGGADYGGGVWDLLAHGPRAARQRQQIAHSLGPIWEANHVWLILAMVVLLTGFPQAFARITTVLHVPLLLVLLGIVARGAAFSFRSYGRPDGQPEAVWGRLFAVASLLTPLLLGVVLGAVASGRLPPATATTAADYLTPWLGLFPFAVGLFTLALFAFLAAVYLAHDAAAAGEGELSADFRRRALAAGVLLAPLAAGTLAIAGRRVPHLLHDLTRTPWSWALHAATAAAAVTALAALLARRHRLARAAAALQVALILAGWAFAQYPFLVPPDLTIAGAAAPPATLRLLLGALAAGALLLLPAFFYLYRVFGRLRRPGRHGL
jgi:cytochrome d ubiquinol oxidase subunit II